MLSLAVGSSAAFITYSSSVNGRPLAHYRHHHHQRQQQLLWTSHQLGFFKGLQSPPPRTPSAPISSFRTAIAAVVDSSSLNSSFSDPPSADVEQQQQQPAKKYYFVVANAKFMLDEEEHFKELLFERLRNYGERSKEQDFWLVIEPKFLDNFPNITKRLKRPAVALVSTNAPWITFMKLRLDRVLSDSYEADTLEEALASNPTTLVFEKPEKWVAPYPKYEFGWWEAFLPAESRA